MEVKTKIILFSILILTILAGCSSMKSTDLINAVIPASNFDKIEMAYGAE